MKNLIRFMQKNDKSCVMEMMREFYSSPAVWSSGSDEIFDRDIENCTGDNPYVEGYVFDRGGDLLGYAMIAKSYSTEFGKPCIWIEDLYIKKESRGLGIGGAFIDFITQKYANCLFRLEVEEENEAAVGLYKKCGFTVLPYMEMKR